MMQKTILLTVLVASVALAQNSPAFEVRQVALPLTSVGDQVNAGFGVEDYRLVVSGSSLVRTVIELFSPETNKTDYTINRTTGAYFGDELYGKDPDLKTTFTLREESGRILAKRTFGTSEKHDIQRFFAGVLRPGKYTFQVESKGNGKNSFAVRASNNVRLEASEFSVNLHSPANQDQLVGFIDVPVSAIGQSVELSNFDADGDQEMKFALIAPDSSSLALTTSGNNEWQTTAIPVTEALVGRWRVVARTLETTKQFSNAFSMRVRLGKEPLYTTFPGFQSPTSISLKATAISCGSSAELPPLEFMVNGIPVKTGEIISAVAGKLNITAPALAGAWLRPIKAVAIQDQTTEISIEYVVLQRIVLTPKPLGSAEQLTATVSTLFAYPMPTKIELDLPTGATTTSLTLSHEGLVSSGNPLVWTVPIQNPSPSNQTRATAHLARECGSSQAISAVR